MLHLLLPSVNDTLEVSALQRSTTDKTAVDVGLGEELRSVRGLARATIQDAGVLGNSLTILLGYDRADVGVDFLGLFSGSCLAGANSPDRLVGDDDLTEVLLREVEDRTFQFGLDDLVLLVSLALGK